MRNQRLIRRILGYGALALMLGVPAEAYYHYVYYRNGSPIRAAFNWSTLPNYTLTFYVSDGGPSIYATNDSMGSILGEVKQAVAAWNSVTTSNLRVAFGGVENQSQTENTPGGDIVFQELAPGTLGLGTPNLPSIPTVLTGPNGLPYVPIQRATVILTNNTSTDPGPSNSEDFFTTAVHEIGHALGLQHTWTGSAMSQDMVRNTSRARPIDADDRAAMSVLYGSPSWAASYGTISGHVAFTNGQPVVLASVVAIPLAGPAVSALTDPNGNYTISGLPLDNYLLYVHPLPPDAIPVSGEGLKLPINLDQGGVSIPASAGAFQTAFYPGTIDWTQAQTLRLVSAGSNFTANFSVRAQASVSMYNVATYGFLDALTRNYTNAPAPASFHYTSPAFLNSKQGMALVGAVYSPFTAPQSVTVLGGFASAPNCAISSSSPCYSIGATPLGAPELFAYFNPPLAAGTGQRHMVFTLANDVYVLPGGVNLVQKAPPYVDYIFPNADGTVTVGGTNLGSDSTVYFDGLPASGSYNNGVLTVTPPPGTSGQVSAVTVYNSDGQNSRFLQGDNLPTYTYPTAATPSFTANPSQLPAGTLTARVEINSSTPIFVDGQVSLGFGSSDVTVSRVWVMSPTRLVANVTVVSNAALGFSEISVISGFQVMTQPFGFQILPSNPALPAVAAVSNGVTSQATMYPGGAATIWGSNLAGAQLTLNGLSIQPFYSASNQVNFLVPASTATGAAILTVIAGSGSVTLAIPVSNPPPTITSIVNFSSSTSVDSTHAATVGDILYVQVAGLDPTVLSNLSRLKVTVAGIGMTVLTNQVTGTQIPIILGQSFGASQVPVVVVVDGSASSAFTILAR